MNTAAQIRGWCAYCQLMLYQDAPVGTQPLAHVACQRDAERCGTAHEPHQQDERGS